MASRTAVTPSIHLMKPSGLTNLQSILAGSAILFPKFPYPLFYWSTLVTMILTITLSPFAAQLDRSYLTSQWNPQLLELLSGASRSIFLDPAIFQLISVGFLVWLAYMTARNVPFDKLKAIFISLSPVILLSISYLFVELILKPGFSYTRPSGFDFSNEPPIMSFAHFLFSFEGSTPSGAVVRQMVLMMTAVLYIDHPSSPIQNPKTRWLVKAVSILLVLVVALARVAVNAHTIFDVVFAIASGSIVFWVLYVIPYSVFRKNGAPRAVANMYLVYMGLMIFYSKEPFILFVSSFLIILVLLSLDRVSEALGFTISEN